MVKVHKRARRGVRGCERYREKKAMQGKAKYTAD